MCTAPSSSLSELSLRLLLPLLLVAIASPAAAQAPTDPRNMAEKPLEDPIDGHEFLHSYQIGTNGLGGYDSDGCAYARGTQPRTTGIATSPTTLFSAPMESWPTGMPDDVRETLLRRLLDVGKDVGDARSLRPSERYELAAMSAEVLGKTDFTIGELYLIGAWTVRDTIVGFLPGVQGAGDAWTKLAETVRLAQAQKDPAPRTRAMFDLARLSHRGGFVVERDEFMRMLDTFEDAGLGAKEKRVAFFLRVDEENRLLFKARERFQKGLEAKQGTPEEHAYYRYLVGDLSRRLGEFDEARTNLEAAELSAGSGEEVKALAKDVLQVIKVQERPPKDAPEGPRK